MEAVPDENNPSIVRYRTKGDNNDVVDQNLVSRNMIIGKVSFCVPGLGYVAEYIQNPPGLYVALLISALMIAIVFYTDSLSSRRPRPMRLGIPSGVINPSRRDAPPVRIVIPPASKSGSGF